MIAIKPWHAGIAAFVGCFALAWLCAEVQIDTIENDLVTRTEQVLANLKIEKLHVHASGRDIVLEGVAPTEGARQTAVVNAEAVEGVFTVTNRLRVAKITLQPDGALSDPAIDCCEAMTPEIEKPGSSGDRAFPNRDANPKLY